MAIRFFMFINLLFWLVSCSQEAANKAVDSIMVSSIDEFDKAVANIQPGDIITMANGTWENVELKLKGVGTEEDWIRLRAETPGKVIISGQSNLAFSGEYIEISGLVFKDGHTPTSAVISFRTSVEELANNSRVTNCVIDDFSNPERFTGDHWVFMYGKNNRFDSNSLIDKTNRGVTMAVKMDTEASRDNKHVIENNYFGPRPVFGSNEGETLRIGTSHFSREYSNTIIQNNYFDRVNGEHEIISSKSCGNVFRNNVFFESQGTLTMRHGTNTLVENNYFLGNGKANTGGIRIINEYQTVKNNYLVGLTGHRFRGALVIMNGVPNSPPNRYNQVVDSYMENNIVINSDYIQLCAGSDEERSAVPVGSTFKNNLILGNANPNPFTIYDDVSGIDFSGNIMSDGLKPPFNQGFELEQIELIRNENGLLAPPADLVDKIGFGPIALPVTKEEVGAAYYPKREIQGTFGTGKKTAVASGTDTLLDAIRNSSSGDILVLENGGEYVMTKYALVDHPLTIMTDEGDKGAILSERQSFFRIQNGGALMFKNVLFDGASSPDQSGNNVITTAYAMNKNYALVIEDCEVRDLDKNHSFNFIKPAKYTFADSVVIVNSKFTNVTGSVLTLDMEVEDIGNYNAENVKIINSVFTDVKHEVANVYRGGTDESTFGPIMTVKDIEITNCGHGQRNNADAALRFHGVQKLNVDNVKISDSKGIDLYLTNGEPITSMSNITFVNSDGLKANNDEYQAENIVVQRR
ncbi:MAG: chondroitinase-B domain-containing protein [Cyclobacteriaceae bacterium]